MNYKEILRKMQKFNFSYDKSSNDLFLFSPKSKSKGSIELGDLVIDFNSKKEVVGIQIMNASAFLKSIIPGEDAKSIKSILTSLEDAKVDVKTKNNLLLITICLVSKNREISPVIPVVAMKTTSPSLLYA